MEILSEAHGRSLTKALLDRGNSESFPGVRIQKYLNNAAGLLSSIDARTLMRGLCQLIGFSIMPVLEDVSGEPARPGTHGRNCH